MPISSICLQDPRLEPYRQVQDQKNGPAIVVEGEFAVQRLLASAHPVHSVVATPKVAQRLFEQSPHAQVYCLEASELRALAGFAFHRGCMAAAPRPALMDRIPQSGGVVAMGLSDPVNVGALIRNIKAFGATGLWLGPNCADPYSRRATRASMGHNFQIPLFRLGDPLAALEALAARGTACIAAALGEHASPLPAFTAPPDWTLWVGNEGHGLDAAVRERCSHGVEIPMAPDCDSLNVAVATGIFLYALTGYQDPQMR